MRRRATALRQATYDPSDTGQGSASSTTPLGLHLNYSMEFRLRRVGDIPPALMSSLLPSFPFLEKPKTGNLRHLLQLNSRRKLTVRSPHYLTKRVRWISNLTNKRCWCNSPSRRGRRPVCGGLLARNPQVGSASLLTRRTIVSSLYLTTGQIPMVLVPPLGGRYLLAQETESGGRTIRCATYEETSRRRRDCTPTGSEPACQNNRGRSHCNKE